jgi:xanthine dehydrogenase accessory factor
MPFFQTATTETGTGGRGPSVYGLGVSLARAGRPFAVATVVRTIGSTPQTIGAKLVVTDRDHERPVGTLGGGCVEADAILAARQVLAGGERSLRAYELTEPLALNTGLVCGGTMWILIESGVEACGDEQEQAAIAAALSGGPPVAWVTRLRRDGRQFTVAGRLFVEAHGGISRTFGSRALDEEAGGAARDQMRQGTPRLLPEDETHEWLVEPIGSRPGVVVAGGGHVGRAIARQALLLDFDVTIIEDRPEFAAADRFPGATVICDDIPAALGRLSYTWHTHVIVATRGHKLDADCVLAASRSAAPHIGLLGSRRKSVLVAGLLRAEGLPPERIAAIRVPIGLDLGGRTPEEIALSVMAEITQLRYGGSGKPLAQVSVEREPVTAEPTGPLRASRGPGDHD